MKKLSFVFLFFVLVGFTHSVSLSDMETVIDELEKLEPEVLRTDEELWLTYIHQEKNVRINGKWYFHFAVMYSVATSLDGVKPVTERVVAAYVELKFFLFIPYGVRVHFVMDRSGLDAPLDGIPDMAFNDDLDRTEREELRDAAARGRLHLYERKMLPLENEAGGVRFDEALLYLRDLYQKP